MPTGSQAKFSTAGAFADLGSQERPVLLRRSILRNKRPGLSGRPHCKGIAIGVAKRGGGVAVVNVRSVFPCPSVIQSAVGHAGGPHVASFVVGRPCACMRACVRAGMVAQCAASSDRPCVGVRACVRVCVRAGMVAQRAASGDRPCAGVRACVCAGVAQCAASSKEKRPAGKEGGNPEQEKGAVARELQSRVGRGRRERRVYACVRRNSLRACCDDVERAEGGESGARALACAATSQHRSFVTIPVVPAGFGCACASSCAGAGGGVRRSACEQSVTPSGSRAGYAEACGERTPLCACAQLGGGRCG